MHYFPRVVVASVLCQQKVWKTSVPLANQIRSQWNFFVMISWCQLYYLFHQLIVFFLFVWQIHICWCMPLSLAWSRWLKVHLWYDIPIHHLKAFSISCTDVLSSFGRILKAVFSCANGSSWARAQVVQIVDLPLAIYGNSWKIVG